MSDMNEFDFSWGQQQLGISGPLQTAAGHCAFPRAHRQTLQQNHGASSRTEQFSSDHQIELAIKTWSMLIYFLVQQQSKVFMGVIFAFIQQHVL